jgi:hypothetical protein
MPSGTAVRIAISIVSSVSATVGSMRCRMRVETGSPEKIEVPRSPRTTWPIQMPIWIGRGRSRPRLARMRAMSWGVA